MALASKKENTKSQLKIPREAVTNMDTIMRIGTPENSGKSSGTARSASVFRLSGWGHKVAGGQRQSLCGRGSGPSENQGDCRRQRMREKIALIVRLSSRRSRHLYDRGFSRQDIISLFRFIDWIMFLPEKEDDLFWKKVSVFEKEGKMPYITSVERIGYKRGIQQGRSVLRSVLARQIAKKFNSRPDREMPKLERLSPDDFPELGEQLLDLDSLEAVHQWIDRRTAREEIS